MGWIYTTWVGTISAHLSVCNVSSIFLVCVWPSSCFVDFSAVNNYFTTLGWGLSPSSPIFLFWNLKWWVLAFLSFCPLLLTDLSINLAICT